jgi:hypothetical protein
MVSKFNPSSGPPSRALAKLIFARGLDQIEKAYRSSTEPLEASKRNAAAIVREANGMTTDDDPPEHEEGKRGCRRLIFIRRFMS